MAMNPASGMTAYLDNSATTRPFDAVIAAMAECMSTGFYNPSAMYRPAIDAENALKALRRAILKQLPGASGDIYFVSGGTEGNDLAILGTAAVQRGKARFICSAVEHPSVLEPMRSLAAQGHDVVEIPVDSRGVLELEALEQALTPDTALVSCMHVNNEVGAIQPIAQIAALIRQKAPGALLHVDGVQAFMRVPFPGRDVSLYTLSGHKIHGPKGIGALYVKSGVRIKPRQLGGGQESGMRSGTENTPGLAGLAAAIAQYAALPDPIGRLYQLKHRLWNGLKAAIPDCELNGPDIDEGAGHILNVSFTGVRGEVMLHSLEAQGVYVSTGSACSSKKRKVSPVLTAMGIGGARAEGALRFSLSPLTSDAEIDMAVEAAKRSYTQLINYKRR